MNVLRKLLTILVVLATLAIGVLFSLQNKAAVPLDLLVYSFEPRSIAIWVLLAFALGGLLGMLVSSLIIMRTRASLVSCKRQLSRVREESSKARVEQAA